ncbi:glycerate kinase [Erysipelotrichaceae bacterium HCN-30851]
MKVVIACDSYKGCMTSREVAQRMEEGIWQVDSNICTKSYIIADGGEGTVEAFHETCHGKKQIVQASDAYGKRIMTEYTIIDDGNTAVIEVANIIGLNMHEREKRAPFFGSSFGVGTVILHAVEMGCKKIIIGLGGSATNDGGMGLLQALGCRYYDSMHQYLSPQAMNLEKVRYIDFNRLNKLEDIELIAACDVKNHLLGENGATYVFGKQKGFYPNQIRKIETGMENFRNQIQRYTSIDINEFEGGGAAGGIGAVLIGLLGAKMIPGIDLLLSCSDIEEEIADCDLVITGEGQSDQQTVYGKVPVGILRLANRYQKPCICISGALGIGYQSLYDLGFIGIYSIADRAMSFQQALEQAPEKLTAATYGIMKTIQYFYKGQ